jgi:PPM family protein phosphatase
MKTTFTGITDTGVLRSVNQDSYYIDPDGRFFIVADGMGGHAGGQEASQIAVSEIKTYLEANWDSEQSSPDLLACALDQANEGILEDQAQNPNRKEMGTTVVILIFREKEQPWIAHVGDSRLYRFSNNQLTQVTNDHTWVAQALKSGEIKPEFARVHPWRHVLCQCLGRKEQQEADIDTLELSSGDILLLCSDGLTEEVSDELIENYLKSNLSLEEIAQKLVDSAKQAGGSDNITIILTRIE